MKILIDENLPRKLAAHLEGHECRTVVECGLSGKRNGELLALADPLFDVLLTLDKNLPYQTESGLSANHAADPPRVLESDSGPAPAPSGMPCRVGDNPAPASGPHWHRSIPLSASSPVPSSNSLQRGSDPVCKRPAPRFAAVGRYQMVPHRVCPDAASSRKPSWASCPSS
jgi:hypothetical protein